MSPADTSVADRILAALAERGAGKTLCPSEIARALAGEAGAWREHMSEVHHAVDHLTAAGLVRVSWKGKPLARREGPYRIGAA